MRNIPPSTEFEARVTGFSSGLVGTVGVRILNNVGDTIVARTTLGIIEDPAGSGSYVTTLVSPIVLGQYSIFWDIGSLGPGKIASEDITVTGGLITTTVLPGEVYASVGDINANLNSTTVVATADNTAAIQVSVARIVRAILSTVIPAATIATWTDPTQTPEIVREAAAKLIAAQLYANETSQGNPEITDVHFAQRRYNEGMAILNLIVSGGYEIEGLIIENVGEMNVLNFHPSDDTDRAFTMSMEL